MIYIKKKIFTIILCFVLVVFICGCNNKKNNKKSEKKSSDILKEKFDKENVLFCTARFKATDEENNKGINYTFFTIYVYYNDNDDKDFYLDPNYTIYYKTYEQALADYDNQIADYQDWETNVEEDISDGTGEITKKYTSLKSNGETTVQNFMKNIRDNGAECSSIK